MKVGLLSNNLPTGTTQIVLASLCVYAFVIKAGYARINNRPLRWLTDKMAPPPRADDTNPTHEDGETPSRRLGNSTTDHGPTATSSPHRVAEMPDLIPRVNGLSFVNDYPRVMRFHAGPQSLWTTQRTVKFDMDRVVSHEQSADKKKCPAEAAESATRRFSLQGVVAGASFIGGLAVSLFICFLCYRVRRSTTRTTFERKQSNDSSIVATVLDSEEVKTEP